MGYTDRWGLESLDKQNSFYLNENYRPVLKQNGVQLSSAISVSIQLSAAQAATADTDAVMSALTDDGSEATVTTGLTNPPYPRNITATSGGTAGDIGAIQVTVTGTNIKDETISETLPVFTADNATTVVGNKAFKTVTQVVIPAHDGTGATTAIGFGDKIGLPVALDGNRVIGANHGGTRETTAPTVGFDSDEVEKNTVDLNTALDGTAVEIFLMV